MRIFSIALVICVVPMAMGCAGRRMAEISPPVEMDAAREAAEPVTVDLGIAEYKDLLKVLAFGELENWKLASPVNTYDKKSLFDYINGAAELYLVYDFRAVAAAEYQDGETSIMIDVYDMTSPEKAFGIYSLNRYPEANYVGIGNEGILTGAALDFWKGKYFCKVYSFDMSEKYEKDVMNFGNRLASRMQEAGEEPSVVRSLPQDGLIPRTAKFFTRKLGLDNIHYVSEENVFNLNAETRGVVAEYQVDGTANFQFFIIEYPSPEEASSAFEVYSDYLDKKGEHVPLKAANGKPKMVRTDDRFSFVKVTDQMILGFWDVESREIAETIPQGMK